MFLLCFCLDYLDDLDLDYYKLFPFKINVPCSFKLGLLNGIHLELYLKVLSNSNCAHLSLTLFPNITFHWKLEIRQYLKWGFFFLGEAVFKHLPAYSWSDQQDKSSNFLIV